MNATLKKKPKYISFATQKGGAGKSSFTVLVASMAHYALGYNVAIIDCDFPQYSIQNMRDRDLKNIPQNEQLKKIARSQFSKHQKKIYPVACTDVSNAIEVAAQLQENSETPIDFVFFDLPGTVNQQGMFNLVCQMDYIFTPVTADRTVVESSLSFLTVVKQQKEKGVTEVAPYAFWNMVDGREKTTLFEVYNKLFAGYNIGLLKTTIPYLLRFHKEVADHQDGVFRCTMLSSSPKLLESSRVDSLCNEVIEIIK